MTGDCYDHGVIYDTISFSDYMYVGFKVPTCLEIPKFPFSFGEQTIDGPAQKIIQIGEKRPGSSTAGSAILGMLGGSFLTFAGKFQCHDDGTLLLFHPWKDGHLQFVPKFPGGVIPGTKYVQMYVAFFDFCPELILFQKRGQTSRVVAKVLKFAAEK